jgi:hypothetical protein
MSMGEHFHKISETDAKGNLKAGYQAEESPEQLTPKEADARDFPERQAENLAGPLAGDSINDTPEGAQS